MRRFAFIIHPLETEDYFSKFPIVRKMPKKIVEKAFRYGPPLKLSEITKIESANKNVEGFLLACPLTTGQILNLPSKIVHKKISEAINLSIKMGAELVGLGGHLALLAERDTEEILEYSTIPVLNGRNYYIVAALGKALKIADQVQLDLASAQIAIIGANSIIGSLTTQILASKSNYITLVAEHNVDLTKLTRKIMYEQGIALKISRDIHNVIKNNDIIILASSVDKTVINPHNIKEKAIIVDLLRQEEILMEVKSKRNDLIVVEEENIRIPEHMNFNFEFHLPKDLVCASMSETMILALENKYNNYTLGKTLDMSGISEISKMARKHGCELQERLDII